MGDRYALQNSPSTFEITLDGESVVIRHCRLPLDTVENIGEEALKLYRSDEEFPADEVFVPDTPFAIEVCRLTMPEFTSQLRECIGLSSGDGLDTDEDMLISKGLDNCYNYLPGDESRWKNYPETEFSDTDVVGAFLTLVNVGATVGHAERALEQTVGQGAAPLLSEEYFNKDIVKGIALALRDAHVTRTPVPPLRAYCEFDDREAVRDAVETVLGISLTDAELHGLLLAPWNKSNKLQSASSYGKQRQAEQVEKVLSGIAESVNSDQ